MGLVGICFMNIYVCREILLVFGIDIFNNRRKKVSVVNVNNGIM